jgi:hypothetical protein
MLKEIVAVVIVLAIMLNGCCTRGKTSNNIILLQRYISQSRLPPTPSSVKTDETKNNPESTEFKSSNVDYPFGSSYASLFTTRHEQTNSSIAVNASLEQGLVAGDASNITAPDEVNKTIEENNPAEEVRIDINLTGCESIESNNPEEVKIITEGSLKHIEVKRGSRGQEIIESIKVAFEEGYEFENWIVVPEGSDLREKENITEGLKIEAKFKVLSLSKNEGKLYFVIGAICTAVAVVVLSGIWFVKYCCCINKQTVVPFNDESTVMSLFSTTRSDASQDNLNQEEESESKDDKDSEETDDEDEGKEDVVDTIHSNANQQKG